MNLQIRFTVSNSTYRSGNGKSKVQANGEMTTILLM